MWTSYLKIAYRNLCRNQGYATLNLVGLAIGLACVLLIFTYVRFEFSFDAFHEHSDRIYHVLTNKTLYGRDLSGPTTSAPTGPALVRALPEVEAPCIFLSSGARQAQLSLTIDHPPSPGRLGREDPNSAILAVPMPKMSAS